MDIDKDLPYKLLEQTIGVQVEILANEYTETPGSGNSINTYQKMVLQVKDEDPDRVALGVLYSLSLMSFSFSAPRGLSGNYFDPDEQWCLGYFLQGLEFRKKCLCFSADYVSGRQLKTDILFEPGGRVTIETRNRGRSVERWVTNLQGKKHIEAVK